MKLEADQVKTFIDRWNSLCSTGREIQPAGIYGKPALMIRDTTYKSAIEIAEAMIEKNKDLLRLAS